MPKIKTNRGTAKRFKVTGTGKIKRQKANTNHILTKKAQKRKRQLGHDGIVADSDKKSISRLMPYA